MVFGAALFAVILAADLAHAEQGDWILRAGVTMVSPDSDNGNLALERLVPALGTPEVEVDDGTQFTFSLSYFLTDAVAVELLAALPFKHDISVQGFGEVGVTKHLPPTLTVQYHFNNSSQLTPYVGAGLNWTMFFEEDLKGPFNGLPIVLDDSFGLALEFGLNWDVNERWMVNFEARYMDIETDVEIADVDVGKVAIDPMVYAINVGYRF